MRNEAIITGQITDFITQHQDVQDITQTTLEQQLNMSKSSVSRACKILVQKQIIKKEKKGKFNILKLKTETETEIETEIETETETETEVYDSIGPPDRVLNEKYQINAKFGKSAKSQSQSLPTVEQDDWIRNQPKIKHPEFETGVPLTDEPSQTPKDISQLEIAKETVIHQQEEIDNLKKQLNSVKSFISGKQPFTFLTFSEYMLEKARKTGSNSYKWGELAFRKTDLKNIYLIILELKELKLL